MLGIFRHCCLSWLAVGIVSCIFEARADTTSEAQAEAARIVSSVILTLPDGTSMGIDYTRLQFSSDWSARYWQHSEFRWTLVEEPLSAADRLNGVTWKGTIKSTVAAYRELYESSSYSPWCWNSWRDISPEFNLNWSLQKIRGQWSLKGAPSTGQRLVGNKLPTQAEADRVLGLPPCPP
jgi:hypothetical protein